MTALMTAESGSNNYSVFTVKSAMESSLRN